MAKMRGFDKGFHIYFPNFSERDIFIWQIKVLNPLLGIDINLRKTNFSSIPIDIYIPVTKKDIGFLTQVVKAARENIKHPINKIFIVGNKNDEIEGAAKLLNAVFVDELTVLGYGKTRINYVVEGDDRSGWLYQQLLKLNADKITKMDNFLVLDADTLLIKPKIFLHKHRFIFDMSEERHEPYHKVYKKIMQKNTSSTLSFITHYMIFNRHILKNLKLEIEKKHNKPWDEVIIENTDYQDKSGFSEYELYGNYALHFFSKKVKFEYWFNSSSDKCPNPTKSISFHSYSR